MNETGTNFRPPIPDRRSGPRPIVAALAAVLVAAAGAATLWAPAPAPVASAASTEASATCGGAPPPAVPVHLSARKFRRLVERAEVPVLVEFGADYCLPCRRMVPVLEAVAADFTGRAVVARVDVATQPALTADLGVVNLPTMMLFQDGKLVRRETGSRSRKELGRLLERSLSRAGAVDGEG